MLRALMAKINPFKALRPDAALAAQICELPYDVMSSEEARQLAEGNPLSFLRVSKPEIELPPGTDIYSQEVYERGRVNFRRMIDDGALRMENRPGFYLYRQVMGSHSQTGLVAVASCEDYLRGVVRKHEFTRPDKEDDRVRHIETLDAQTGPVFLVRPCLGTLDEFLASRTNEAPEVDFTAQDGVRHSAWSISNPVDIAFVQREIENVPILFIADGHHRCAAAARVYQKRRGAGESGWFLSVIFPQDQVRILPYNRVLKDLNGHTLEAVMSRLEKVFTVESQQAAEPAKRHQLCFYTKGAWRVLQFRPELIELGPKGSAVDCLDVELLQKHVLAPVFGIDDPRTSQRISFVGGVRGTAELERMVDTGAYACAFSMFPTGIDELMAVAEQGGVMPPKSTWFEPKLRDAMFCHLLSNG
jgi:uncharacterized protein (DUF1015 family)